MNIANIINVAAVIVAAAYTLLTYYLWRESTKQTKQSLMPLPVIYKQRSRDRNHHLVDKFIVKNIGYGPALNIIVEEFNLQIKDEKTNKLTGEKYTLTLNMGDPNVLDKNEERVLRAETQIKGVQKRMIDLSAHIDPDYAEEEIPLTITYQDIMGRTYYFKILFGKGNLRIENPPQELHKK